MQTHVKWQSVTVKCYTENGLKPVHPISPGTERISANAERRRTAVLCQIALLALQDFAVKWVRSAPERFAILAESEASLVTGIQITALQTQG